MFFGNLLKKKKKNIAGIAITNPVAVVINASPIFAANNSGLPIPVVPMVLKALIIPDTVPNKPSIGALAPIIER